MKKLVFIDANNYLRFYDNNSRQFKNLLKSVIEIKDNIFITKQIRQEVERRKLKVFIESLKNYDNQLQFHKITLPEHLESGSDEKIKGWNKKWKEILNNAATHRDDLIAISSELIDKISEGKDEVSTQLESILKNAKVYSDEEIKKARERKEFGNPPGKQNDTLGDQISWEQLLSKAPKCDELWIITSDRDYYFEYNKKLYLNPLLFKELKEKNKSLKLHLHDTLAKGLTTYNVSSGKKLKKLPETAKLEEIEKEEKKSNVLHSLNINQENLGNFFPNPSGYLLSPSGNAIVDSIKICPVCSTEFIQTTPYMYGKDGFYYLGCKCPNCDTIVE